jgi:hypothetical protein
VRSSSILIALLALLAAACQPVPQPFQPDRGSKGPKTLAPLVDGGGIVVRPVDGAPPAVSAALQRAMIEALAAQNITAATSGQNVESRFLTAAAKADPQGGRLAVAVTWSLADQTGKKLGDTASRMSVPRGVWARPDHKLLAPLARDAAPALAALMQEPAVDPVREAKAIPLHVWPVAGAEEGNGALTLRRAMEAALQRRGYRITETLAENGLVVAGNVQLGEAADGRRPIAVEWAVMGPDGAQYGKLDQKNSIPVGALKDGWGGLAYAIAETAAGGIGTLLNRLPADGSPAKP